jgi:phospholipid-binding lipoprotein MlaA
MLQGKLERVGIETARFVVNTTIGLLGFFDPADAWWHLKPHEEDFGQTLGHYGLGDGFPLQLPLLGPSNARDTVGVVPDSFLSPIDWFYQGSAIINPLFLGAFILEIVNKTSLNIGVYENFKKEALDPYTLMRDAYKQNRDARIKE